MDPTVTSALIGAGSSILGGGVSAVGSSIRTKKQWQYRQKEMALQQQYALAQMQKQYDYWKQQTDYMNTYNEPSALLARWRSAGVTPAGVLGQSGVAVSGNSASGPGSSGQGIGAAGMDVQNSLGFLGSGITAAGGGDCAVITNAAPSDAPPAALSFPPCRKRQGRKGALGRVWCVLRVRFREAPKFQSLRAHKLTLRALNYAPPVTVQQICE